MRRPTPESSGFFEEVARAAKRHAKNAAGLLALALVEPVVPPEPAPPPVAETAPDPEPFVSRLNGEYSPEERLARTRTLPNGAKLFNDAGIFFYQVQPGDTLSDITEALSREPEFAYLRKLGYGIASYNAKPTSIRPGMWLPVPAERGAHIVNEAEFRDAAARGIDRVLAHPEYATKAHAILRAAGGKNGLVDSMLAVAKVESGGTKLGELALVRYEPSHNAFSYSLFHVLMKKAGLRARKTLGLTEGELFQHDNGAALFLAFLIEKDVPVSVFPIAKHAEEFSAFYNGAKWREINPDYAARLAAALR